jgi:hypothetical protein
MRPDLSSVTIVFIVLPTRDPKCIRSLRCLHRRVKNVKTAFPRNLFTGIGITESIPAPLNTK